MRSLNILLQVGKVFVRIAGLINGKRETEGKK